MLWACLYFSDLPLRAVFEDSEQALPCAVVDGPRQRPHIVLANTSAQRHGVGAGRVLAASRALCSTLQARTRDRPGEQRLLLSLAAWAYRFSSHVSLCEPDALLIEVGASLRLFGGWPALERRLRRELAAIGHAPAIAVAPLPAAARVLAAQHDDFFTDQREPMLTALGCVAIAGSGLDDGAISLLYNVGARTLRDAFALPRAELARRIGPPSLAALDRLRGLAQEILPLYEPPDRFEHRIEFDDRIEAWPPLLFPLRRLCGELALFLAARDGGVQRCDLVLDHEDKPATRVVVELLTPQREAGTLYELVRSRLERVALAAPVCGIALVATDLPEFRPRHQDLFEPQREQGLEWPELAERLRAHLGDDAVRRLAAAADHRPERAWCFMTGTAITKALPRAGDAAAIAASRYKMTGPGLPQPDPSLKPALSPLPLVGEAAPPRAPSETFRNSGQCSVAQEVGRVRVAHEAAAVETLPHFGSATLTPALSRQRERGKNGTAANVPPLPLVGEAAPPRAPSETFRNSGQCSVAQEVGRVRVAHEAATSETLPRSVCAPAIAETWSCSTNVPAIAETASQYATTSLPSLTLSIDQGHSAEPGVSRPGLSPAPLPGAARPQARLGVAHDAAMPVDSRPRPLWLLRRALPLRGAAPRILAGPERIESGWWDGGDTRRDYYIVQTREGQRAWAYLMAGTNDGWMLHGWFA